jgi:DHA3 family macrolide efflux protein-like MFS transporter
MIRYSFLGGGDPRRPSGVTRSEKLSVSLTLGVLINGMGSWAALIALWGFASYQYQVDAKQLSALTLAWAAPTILVAPLVSSVSIRVGPGPTLRAGMIFGALTASGLFFANSYATLIVLAFCSGTARGIVNPMVDSLAGWIVQPNMLLGANAQLSVASESAMVVGPLVAAAFSSVGKIQYIFLLDALTFIVSIPLINVKHRRGDAIEAQPPPRSSRNPRLAWSMSIWLVTACLTAVYTIWSAFLVLEPLYVRDELRAPQSVFAVFQATYGLGLVLASLAIRSISQRFASGSWCAIITVVFGMTALLYLGTSKIVIAGVGAFLWGCTSALVVILSRTHVQLRLSTARSATWIGVSRSIQSTSELIMIPVAGGLVSYASLHQGVVIVSAIPILTGAIALTLISVLRTELAK